MTSDQVEDIIVAIEIRKIADALPDGEARRRLLELADRVEHRTDSGKQLH